MVSILLDGRAWIDHLLGKMGLEEILFLRSANTLLEPMNRNYVSLEIAKEGGEGTTRYSVLLHAAMIGESMCFTRQAGVEEAWRIIVPSLLDAPPPVRPCAKGSWRPTVADELTTDYGGWHGPWIES